MRNILNSFLGLNELPIELQKLIIRVFILFSLFQLFLGLGNSFIILAYIEKFGFGIAGFLMAIIFSCQFVTDYPTGSLGDYIGQKWVIVLSLVFFGLGYSIVSSFNSYIMFILASMMFGVGLGQLSGAFESYLDNNYQRLAVNVDEDRKLYGFMYQRVTTIGSVLMGISFLIGGLLSNFYSRDFVFLLTGLLSLTLIPFMIIFLNDYRKKEVEKSTSKPNYFYYLKGGFSFLFSSKKIFFLLVGLAILTSCTMIWGFLILFPFYNLYTGTDAGVGFLRSAIFLTGSVIGIYSARLNKKLNNKYLGRLYLVFLSSLFIGVIILINILPGNDSFNLIGIILVYLLMITTVSFMGSLAMTLAQRALIMNVPSDKRNAIYSLIPTIGLIIQVPFLIVVGNSIEIGGLTIGIVIILILSFIGSMFLFVYHYYDNKVSISQEQDIFREGVPSETL